MVSNKNKINLPVFAYASGIAAGNSGCADGPVYLQNSSLGDQLISENSIYLHWDSFIYPLLLADKVSVVKLMCETLAKQLLSCVQNKQKFIVVGGDHSSAIGTWSGVATAIQKQGPLGLIWIDAHLDSNVFETSPSGNIHGMPVAHLLGYGAKELAHILTNEPKILPNNLCFIGIRSFEEGEAELIRRLGVRVYDMHDIQSRGLDTIIKEAKMLVSKDTAGYGLSIDLDGLDPADVPGIGTPEDGGIDAQQLFSALHQFNSDSNLLGIEIAEFNPHLDKDNKTVNTIKHLISAIFAE